MGENKVDMDRANSLPRELRVEIATKIEKLIKGKVGDYDISKNEEYRRVCKQVADEYGLTLNEATGLYLGWDAYKKLNKLK